MNSCSFNARVVHWMRCYSNHLSNDLFAARHEEFYIILCSRRTCKETHRKLKMHMIRNILVLLMLLLQWLLLFVFFFFCDRVGEKKLHIQKSLCCLNPRALKGKRIQMRRNVGDDNDY